MLKKVINNMSKYFYKVIFIVLFLTIIILLYLRNDAFNSFVKCNEVFVNAITSIVAIVFAIFEISESISNRYNENIRKDAPVLLIRTRNPESTYNEGYANSRKKDNQFQFKFVLNNSGNNIAWVDDVEMFLLNSSSDTDFTDDKIVSFSRKPNLKVFAPSSFSTIKLVLDRISTDRINKNIQRINNEIYIGLLLKYTGVIKNETFVTKSILTLCKYTKEEKVNGNIIARIGDYYIDSIENDYYTPIVK